jgi:undecaprenyl-phosphate 4-deoxy-4-formamido-L-arabinose transferase
MSIPRHVMKVDFSITSFRLIRAEIAAEVAASVRHDIIIDAHLGWLTDRIVATQVEHNQDVRASNYGPVRLIGFFLSLLCNYTTFPLRATTFAGGLMAAGSLLAAVLFVAMHFLVRSGVPGYSSLIVSIFFSTGVVLMGIGVMSEYLARIFMQINHRPQAFVRETAGFAEEAANRRAA